MTTTIDGTLGITLSGASNQITFNDASTQASHANPQVTTYTSGSGTYTTPTGAKYLTVQMVGGGGGGSGGGNAGTGGNGGAGGTTTFGSAFLIAPGGKVGQQPPAGGNSDLPTGGDVNARGSAGEGGVGSPIVIYQPAGAGGSSFFGGAGIGGYVDIGQDASTGSGGGGGGITSTASSPYLGGGGGAGGYLSKVISSPAATYSYAVGAGGTAGSAGTNGKAGGAGGSGVIIVTAYF